MGLFDRFKKGLAKTRDKVVGGIRSVLPVGRKIDEALLTELEDVMIAGDMGPATVSKLIDSTRAAWKRGKLKESQDILAFLKEEMVSMWPETDRRIHFAESGPTVILVVGINGSGKTTSIAKLAYHLRQQSKTVLLAAGDTFRAAAVAQLAEWAKRLDFQIVRHDQGADPGAVAYDACEAAMARNVDVLLIDTAGRLHTQDHLMRGLGKIQNVVKKRMPDAPHEVLLVLDATIGQNAIIQARQFSEVVNVSGIILAKLDGSAKGGIVIGIRDQLSVPVKFVGLGEKAEDIEPFDPATFVDALLSAD